MNILMLNGGKAFAHSGGRYNDTLHDAGRGVLAELGHQIQETRIDEGYDLQAEIDKWLWADTIIVQMPGWWMGPPWIVKRYLDEVLTEGHGSLYASDGRSRKDPSLQYGSGGLLQGRRYMLSLTWNAPREAFDEEGNFFEGKGVDGVYFPVHKAMEFLGMQGLPTYLANDVIKAPAIDTHVAEYREHLLALFSTTEA
ncbi:MULTISPECIES: NAD(P)H-dependent oxidoreductase [Halomonas]|uniref:NAD(P)H-dependent oxidoreductase n=1 Tax=Halomonas TaxID=2745 RepID=UPI001C96D6E3|nr:MULTISPECIES: NAD(P)H-dependent oxidoreductase [Halomonas]MBY5924279.1 NAD(P)H-dependent oxidoreductase [Halomonas sp. DP4Y7-2]MBY5928444.1 NAD(P)H-dependent oxidoreductase [Halomonas sp. DP8Y7-3]MBY5967023.1 NAD(P)H-dependent oxidoreductase [Halomonas denitrificans]MBY5982521.1 NAD(P)H-dependent oxidoreductase [Halomonas sp. DP5Y7-2]MBY6029504.1 NAD(P)H-dependent oxidoreductase [Halomonas sp. DP8Y7-1]